MTDEQSELEELTNSFFRVIDSADSVESARIAIIVALMMKLDNDKEGVIYFLTELIVETLSMKVMKT